MEDQVKPLSLPQISINGTARVQLVEQQCGVLAALDALQKAMREAAPHGRDYQHRPDEYAPAREAWDERVKALDAIYKEIEAHAMAINESK